MNLLKDRRWLFLMGPPKTGSTSIATWLAGHPEVCVSDPKENHFFATDLGPDCRRADGEQEYLRRCFVHQKKSNTVFVDASVYMLRSTTATDEILRRCPDARFLVTLRHPVDLFESLHAQYRWRAIEDESDPWTAWNLQEDRAAGRRVPPGGWRTELLNYRRTVSIGSQISQLRKRVGDRLLILDFNDLRTSPGASYRRILKHLDLQDDGRQDFPIINARKGVRTNGIQNTILSLQRKLPRAVREGVIAAKRAARLSRFSLTNAALRWNRSNESISRLSDAQRASLNEELSGEIRMVDEILAQPSDDQSNS